MKRVFVLLAVLALFVTSVVLPGSACSKGAIKIGVIISLSGAGQAVGADVRDGMMMAVEEINENDSLDGRSLELVFKDAESSGDRAAEVFEELEAEVKPALYIAQHSVNSMAVAPQAEMNNVVLIGLVTSTPEFTENKAWVYRYYSTAQAEIAATMQTLDELNIQSLGILHLNESFGNSFSDLLEDQFAAPGGTVTVVPFGMNTEDYSSPVQQIMDTDAVYIAGYATHISAILKELRSAEYTGEILTNSSSSSPAIVGLPDAEGVYITSSRIYSSDYPLGEQVKAKYEKEYGRTFNHYSANGYDSIKLLADLIGGNDVSREAMKGLFDAGFIHPGVLGTIYIEAGNHEITFPLYPAQILNGEIVFRY